MRHFESGWAIRPARPTTVDESTGNPRPGAKPTPVAVTALAQQRFPRTEQEQIGDGEIVDEQLLLVGPEAVTKLGRPISDTDVVIAPDGDVWKIVRIPRDRASVRGGRRGATKYVALVISRASRIKEK